jgi:hypothetical protein
VYKCERSRRCSELLTSDEFNSEHPAYPPTNRNRERVLTTRLLHRILGFHNSIPSPLQGRMLSASNQCLRRVELPNFARSFGARRNSKYTTQCISPALTRSNARPRAQPFTKSPRCWLAGRQYAVKKSTLKLEDLPQGIIDVEPLPPQDDAEPEYPPLLQQVRNNMLKFKHCVLVTRVGGFYEVGAQPSCTAIANRNSCISNMQMNLPHS